MVRIHHDDKSGFVNEGLEVFENNDDCGSTAPTIFSHNTTNDTKIQITRSKYNQESLNREMVYRKSPTKSFYAKKCGAMSKESVRSCISGTFPIFSWMHAYRKDDFVGDLISGCTVAIMHIPQGMGYALLANLPPVIGIYMAFFPVLLYVIFGTSRHNSMGTFAVISIMVGKSITTYSHEYSESALAKEAGYSAVEVATLICFIVGIIQLIMYILRLGVLSFLLSECLVSGFTTGAAVHVLTSQVKDILGIQLPRIDGNYFKLIKTYVQIFQQLDDINLAAIILSALTITILVFNNEILKPRVAKRTKIPIPIELLVVVGGTLLSKYIKIDDRWNIVLVGSIPIGLPEFTVPRFGLWQALLFDAFAIAFVSYSITVSMALIFGQKLKYEIDFNQELLAMGTGNIFGSFFCCLPFSASLSRSLIQQAVGGKTQMASVISCTLLLFVLLWIGPFFEVLPRCVLASVVIVALKGMLVQVSDFPRFNKKSNRDGLVWLITFLSVIIFSIDMGLFIGICLSVACIFCNGLSCYFNILGRIPETDLFLNIESFQKAVEIPYVKIVQYSGGINFATKASFKNKLCDKLGINLLKELKYQELHCDKSNFTNLFFKHLILDFNALTNIDASSVNMLTSLIKDFNKLNVKVSIVCGSTRIYEILLRNEFIFMNILYPSINDAVLETHTERY